MRVSTISAAETLLPVTGPTLPICPAWRIATASPNNTSPCYSPAGSLTNPNLIDRFEAAGLTWKGYMESQGVAAGCVTGGAEPYTHEHNGFGAFQDITNNTSRCSKIVLANPGSCGGVTDCALINVLNSSSPPSFMWL